MTASRARSSFVSSWCIRPAEDAQGSRALIAGPRPPIEVTFAAIFSSQRNPSTECHLLRGSTPKPSRSLILIKLLGGVDAGCLKSPMIGTNTPRPTAATGKNNYLGRCVVAQVHGERTEKMQFNFPPAEFANR